MIHAMETSQARTGDEKFPEWGWVLAIFNRVVRAGLTEKVKFNQRLFRDKIVSHADIGKKDIIERRASVGAVAWD